MKKEEERMTDFRDSAVELVEDGMVEPMDMLKACLCYMSQDDVRDMLEANEFCFWSANAHTDQDELNNRFKATVEKYQPLRHFELTDKQSLKEV